MNVSVIFISSGIFLMLAANGFVYGSLRIN